MRISSKGLINVTAPTAGGKGEVRATHGEQSVGRGLWEALTPGESPRQQWDVVAPAPGAGVQVVPQLVVGGEIDDCGWHSHHPGRKRAVRAARGGAQGGSPTAQIHTHSVGGSPLHRDLMPSWRVIFTKASCGENAAHRRVRRGEGHPSTPTPGQAVPAALTNVPLKQVGVLYQAVQLLPF